MDGPGERAPVNEEDVSEDLGGSYLTIPSPSRITPVSAGASDTALPGQYKG